MGPQDAPVGPTAQGVLLLLDGLGILTLIPSFISSCPGVATSEMYTLYPGVDNQEASS